MLIWNTLVLILGVIVFAISAIKAGKNVHSPKAFFYKMELPANVISLTAANITLGTGVAYLIQGGQQNGLLMFLIPVMVCVGYFLLAGFVARYIGNDVEAGRNVLAVINERISQLTDRNSRFGLLVTLSLVVVYTVILPYEIFASSKIIAPFIFTEPSTSAQVALSFALFLAALLYVIVGGVAAVFATDKIQLVAITCFLAVLCYLVYGLPLESEETGISLSLKLSLNATVILNVVAASIAAISTQFYSLLNWGYVSHINSKERSPMLKAVGMFSALLFCVIVSLGVFYPSTEGNGTLTAIMGYYANILQEKGVVVPVISGIFVFGMISIVFSTSDSLMIKVIAFFYDNVLKKCSYSEQQNSEELKTIRLLTLGYFLIIFIILCYFNFAQPNLFYLLLAIVAGVNVFAPMIAAAAYLRCRGSALAVFSPPVIWAYFCGFGLVGVIAVTIFLRKPSLLGWVGALAFLVSVVFSGFLVVLAQRRMKTYDNQNMCCETSQTHE